MTAQLILDNPCNPSVEPIEVQAVADTSSVFLCIPEQVRLQLGLEIHETRMVKQEDDSYCSYPYAGPILVRFKNRAGYAGALVRGERVQLGSIALLDLDLVVNPRDRTVDVNPFSPNIATGIVKRVA